MRWLDLLGRQGRMTAGQLSEESGLTTGAVTFLLDRLEEAGFVRRKRDTEDRRRVWVQLTPAALRRLERAQEPIKQEMRELAQRFKAEELAIVRDFMRGAKEVTSARSPVTSPEDLDSPEGERRGAWRRRAWCRLTRSGLALRSRTAL